MHIRSLDADEHLGFDACAISDAAAALSVCALYGDSFADDASAAQYTFRYLAVVLDLYVIQQNRVDNLHVFAYLAACPNATPSQPATCADHRRLHNARIAFELLPLVQSLRKGSGHEDFFLLGSADDAVKVHGLVDLLRCYFANVGVLVAEMDENLEGSGVGVCK